MFISYFKFLSVPFLFCMLAIQTIPFCVRLCAYSVWAWAHVSVCFWAYVNPRQQNDDDNNEIAGSRGDFGKIY